MDEETFEALKAWHGSHADFDKFRDEFINSGEGAQSYGLGHYVAEHRGIAEWYRDSVTNKRAMPKRYSPKLNGISLKRINDLNDRAAEDSHDAQRIGRIVDRHEKLGILAYDPKVVERNDAEWLRLNEAFTGNEPIEGLHQISKRRQDYLIKTLGDFSTTLKKAGLGDLTHDQLDTLLDLYQESVDEQEPIHVVHSNRIDNAEDDLREVEDSDPEYAEDLRNQLKSLRELETHIQRMIPEPSPGRLYELRLNTHPKHLIDWDEPLSKQHPELVEKLKQFPELSHHFKEETDDPEYEQSLNDLLSSFPGTNIEDWRKAGFPEPMGEELYWTMSDKQDKDTPKESQKAAVDKMLAAGIHGIRYRDASTRHKKPHAQLMFNNQPVEAWDGTKDSHFDQRLNEDFVNPANIQSDLEADAHNPSSVDELLDYYKEKLENRKKMRENMLKQNVSEEHRNHLVEKKLWQEDAIDWIEKNRDKLKLQQGRPSYNYVLFDPNLIKIVRKLGMKGELIEDYPHLKEVDHDPFA